MQTSQVLAIAASAYNVCGPRSGESATPRTVRKLNRNLVLHCMAEYSREPEALYTPSEVIEARDVMEGGR